ncbi:Type 1 glutamine amidotransferase-like domain-containing protein [Lachnotalea sp. AF33-28]|jgi:dipeptidase E|uniref:Type 1 glutamine amidotransferase-like domain-containing protein n=1 Tax=Lachnotalea sp. AF33-28 TaxID=2292046 RepID=UPI000E4C1162|nr:Type 1 glutamine amidotransferase-like domain-containing protein [Lachnotalea sp. AF33-28]RHP29862.1 peptidase S51 [Lachnotalea sp. AF33-28]
MKKLFLASLFKDVSEIFVDFANENLEGKTVTFIPTAALPDKLDFHIKYSMELLAKMGLKVDELEISTATHSDIANKLENNDYIYVTGGNTFFLLQEMNRSGAGNLIKAQIEAGKLFIGESAGAILLAPDIEYSKDTDNPLIAPQLKTFEALNMIDFYPLPHYKNDPLKEAVEKVISKYGAELPLVPFSNSQAILITGEEKQIVSVPM